jgi:hypothetical protein
MCQVHDVHDMGSRSTLSPPPSVSLLVVGWMNILVLLCIGAFFSRTCLYIVLALFGTLLLPARPVLWTWFNHLWVFKTWREYFR